MSSGYHVWILQQRVQLVLHREDCQFHFILVSVVVVLHFFPFLGIFLNYVYSILIQLVDQVLELFAVVSELSYSLVCFRFLFFCHKGMAHSVCNRAVVEALECIKLRTEFISYTHEQESSLSAVDSNLPYELIKALLEQFFTYWTNADVSCLILFESLF